MDNRSEDLLFISEYIDPKTGELVRRKHFDREGADIARRTLRVVKCNGIPVDVWMLPKETEEIDYRAVFMKENGKMDVLKAGAITFEQEVGNIVLESDCIVISGDSEQYIKRALWDTGAGCCGISNRVAQNLGLQKVADSPIDTVAMIGQTAPVYSATLSFHDIVIDNVCMIGIDSSYDFLVGMNVIRLGDFVMSHIGDAMQFSFRVPPQDPISFVKK